MKYSLPMKEMFARFTPKDPIKMDRPRTLALALLKVAEAVEGMEKLAANRNPLETDEAHAKRVAAAATKVRDKASSIRDYMASMTPNFKAELNLEIDKKCNLTPIPGAEEYRMVLRNMSTKDRAKAVNDALESGNHKLLSAVFNGDEFLTGVNDEFRSKLKTHYIEKHASDLYEELLSIDTVAKHSDQFLQLAENAVDAAYNPKYIDDLVQMERKAQEAQQSFDEAVG